MSDPTPPGSLPPSRSSGSRSAQRTIAARVTFGILLAVSAALFGYLAWPFRAPLFLAAVLAAVLQPGYRAVVRMVRGHRRLAAVVTTVIVTLVLVAPFASVVGFAAGDVLSGLAFVRDELGVHSVAQLPNVRLPDHAQQLLDRALSILHVSRAQLDDLTAKAIVAAQHAGGAVLTASSRFAFHTAILIIAFYFFVTEGERLIAWLGRVSPLEASQTEELLEEFRRVSVATIVWTAATALLQGMTAALGFALTGVPNPVFFGLVTALAAFIPFVGTALVWVPAVVLLGLAGMKTGAVVLFIWCMVTVVGAEHVVKPLLLRGQVEMNTGLVFLSLLGGIEMFGLIGLVIGPLVIAFFLTLLRMYERDFADNIQVTGGK